MCSAKAKAKATKKFIDTKDGDRKSRCFYVSDSVKDKSFWEDTILPGQNVTSLLVCEPPEGKAYEIFIYFTNMRLLRAITKLMGEKRTVFISDETPKQSYYNVRAGLDAVHSEDNSKVTKLAIFAVSYGQCDNPGIPTVILDYAGAPAGQGDRSDIETIFREIRERRYISIQEVMETYPSAYCRYGGKIKEYFNLIQPKRDWKTEVICYWGEGGVGKSAEVYALEGKDEVEEIKISGDKINPFVHNYSGTKEVVLIDDFKFESVDQNWFLNITDRYAQTVNVKGGSINWNPKRLYICSNYHPQSWWGGWTVPIKRRFNRIIEVRCEKTFDDMEPSEEVLVKKNPLDRGVLTKTGKKISAKGSDPEQAKKVAKLLRNCEEDNVGGSN